ncbi:phosphotransferase [Rathayibacter oskolensis]|uniref:phosphotransferase n=1 Tax=Rathayibacter oskolensis TaxID=1891671 RepID=UPI00265EFA27|nr:phosphotransferase [Rathayibacter oskolensis]WKK73230.1 phosphotransferase [Rathayibacter oskolensis]
MAYRAGPSLRFSSRCRARLPPCDRPGRSRSCAATAAGRPSRSRGDRVRAALREVIGLLQADGTAEVMDEVAAELAEEDEVFSHGDIRGRNILVLPGRGGGVHLIDWETSGRCSRWFDLGAGLALFIETALLAGRGAPSGATLLTYLAAYSRSSGHQIDVALTVQCAGVRLIQSAMESTREGAERSLVAERLLTVGGLALRSPLQVARRLEVLR